MEVKKIVEGMSATQVAQIIDENFKGLNSEKADKTEVKQEEKDLSAKIGHYNISKLYPENGTNGIYTFEQAVSLVTSDMNMLGVLITFRDSASTSKTYKLIGVSSKDGVPNYNVPSNYMEVKDYTQEKEEDFTGKINRNTDDIKNIQKKIRLNIEIVWNNGAFIDKSNGEITSTEQGFSYSEALEISPEVGYYLTCDVSGNDVATVAYYDENGIYIGFLKEVIYTNKKLDIPLGTKYIRCCTNNKTKDLFYLKNTQEDDDLVDYALKTGKSLNELEEMNYPMSERTYGQIFTGGNLVDNAFYSLRNVVINKNSTFRKLTATINATGTVLVCLIDEDTLSVVEKLNRSVVEGQILEILPSDFAFDFENISQNLGIYVRNGGGGTATRYFNYKTTGYNAKAIGSDTSANITGEIKNVDVLLSLKIEVYSKIQPKLVDTIEKLEERVGKLDEEGSISLSVQENIDKNVLVRLGEGVFVIDTPLTIPSGRRIVGVKGKTILKAGANCSSIIRLDANVSDLSIEDVTFEGQNKIQRKSITISDVRNRVGEGTQVGIYTSGYAKNVHIRNCEFRNFDLAGIRLLRTHDEFTRTFKITDCVFLNNWYGLLSDVRSEYHTMMGCSFTYNQIGCFVAGGNNFMTCCHFDSNAVGCVISGTQGNNDSHGSITGSSFNHNSVFGIAIIDINNGFSFDGCHVFDGVIKLYNSKGFVYVGGFIAGKIDNELPNVESVNMIHSNLFFKTYDGGTITDKTSIDLKNNRFVNGSDSSSINN